VKVTVPSPLSTIACWTRWQAARSAAGSAAARPTGSSSSAPEGSTSSAMSMIPMPKKGSVIRNCGPLVLPWSRPRWKDQATSAGVITSPLWKVTPWRMVNV